MRNFIRYDKLYTLYAEQQRQRCDFANTYMISNRMLAIVSIPKSHAGLVAFPLNWHKPCQWGISTSLIFYNLLEILSSILIKYRHRHEFIIKPLCFFLFVNICVIKDRMAIFFLYLFNGGNFHFTLLAYADPLLSPVIPNAVKLDTEIVFNAEASIQSPTSSSPLYPLTGSYFITKRVGFVRFFLS